MLEPAEHMYLAARPVDVSLDSEVIDIACLIQRAVHYIFIHLRDFIVPHVQDALQWIQHTFTWANIVECLRLIFQHPTEWPVYAFYGAKWILVNHTHTVHIVCLSIFFGPIAVLIPLLLIHELVISLLFNMSFVFHGFLRGTADDHYLYLHSLFDDLKGSIFSTVDSWGAKYNKLTTEYRPLVALRLVCLGLGGLALYRILMINQRQALPTTI